MRDRALREKRSVAHVRRFPEPHLSPTATKALSNRGVPGPRLPPSQRQRKARGSVSTDPPAPLRRQKSLPNWRSRRMGSGADSPYQGEMARRARGGRERRHGGRGGAAVPADCACPLAPLKVNWPAGPREGGLGHWLLSGRPERSSPPAAPAGAFRSATARRAALSAEMAAKFPQNYIKEPRRPQAARSQRVIAPKGTVSTSTPAPRAGPARRW